MKKKKTSIQSSSRIQSMPSRASIISIILIFLLMLVFAILRDIRLRRIVESNTNTITIGLLLENNNAALPYMRINYIDVPEQLASTKGMLCIRNISIISENLPSSFTRSIFRPTTVIFSSTNGGPEQPLISKNDFKEPCLLPGTNYLSSEGLLSATVPIAKTIDQFFYPFDTLESRFDLYIDAYWHTTVKSIKQEEIAIKVNYDDATFNSHSYNSKLTQTDHIAVRLNLIRSTIYQLLTICTIPIIILITIFVTRIRDTENFVQAILAMIFGLSGVKAVTIPSYINFPTILDIVFYILFFYLLIIMLYEVYKRTNDTHLMFSNQTSSDANNKHKKRKPRSNKENDERPKKGNRTKLRSKDKKRNHN